MRLLNYCESQRELLQNKPCFFEWSHESPLKTTRVVRRVIIIKNEKIQANGIINITQSPPHFDGVSFWFRGCCCCCCCCRCCVCLDKSRGPRGLNYFLLITLGQIRRQVFKSRGARSNRFSNSLSSRRFAKTPTTSFSHNGRFDKFWSVLILIANNLTENFEIFSESFPIF